jgi:ferritin-like metal-binding protein YciE
VASAQAVEHYEIARYVTLKAWAEQLGLDEVVSVFEATEEEESETDQILTDLSVALNSSAAGTEPRS